MRRSRNESEYREALQHILLEASHTARVVEELLTLARADSGVEALELQRIDQLPTLLPPNFIEYWR